MYFIYIILLTYKFTLEDIDLSTGVMGYICIMDWQTDYFSIFFI